MSELSRDGSRPDACGPLEPLLKVGDLERVLRVDRRTVARLVKLGQLPRPIKVGGSNRWRLQDIKEVICTRAD
jgi:predicted DNA-binding transcriptional regulator AlpA